MRSPMSKRSPLYKSVDDAGSDVVGNAPGSTWESLWERKKILITSTRRLYTEQFCMSTAWCSSSARGDGPSRVFLESNWLRFFRSLKPLEREKNGAPQQQTLIRAWTATRKRASLAANKRSTGEKEKKISEPASLYHLCGTVRVHQIYLLTVYRKSRSSVVDHHHYI
jgi:hypothetical protein